MLSKPVSLSAETCLQHSCPLPPLLPPPPLRAPDLSLEHSSEPEKSEQLWMRKQRAFLPQVFAPRESQDTSSPGHGRAYVKMQTQKAGHLLGPAAQIPGVTCKRSLRGVSGGSHCVTAVEWQIQEHCPYPHPQGCLLKAHSLLVPSVQKSKSVLTVDVNQEGRLPSQVQGRTSFFFPPLLLEVSCTPQCPCPIQRHPHATSSFNLFTSVT